MRRATGWVLRLPVTMSLAALLVACAIIAGPLTGPSGDLRVWAGTGLPSVEQGLHPLSPITSSLFTDGLAELLGALIATLVVIGGAERLMGRWRTLLAWLLTAVIGGAAGMTLQATGVISAQLWSHDAAAAIVLDPFIPIAGAAMAASAFANRLWRRRIRVIGFAALLVFVLYSGTSADLYRLLAAVAGLLLGLLIAPRARVALRWERSSHHEARTLLASLLILGAVAPLISVISRVAFGPVHSLWLVGATGAASPADVCGVFASDDCIRALASTRLDGPGPIITSVAPLLLLALCAFGLLRGRRIAAWLAIAVNVLLAYLSAFYDGFLPWAPDRSQLLSPDGVGDQVIPLILSVLLPLALAVLIGINLAHFSVRPSAQTLRRFVATVIVAFISTSTMNLIAGSVTRNEFEPPATLLNLLLDLPERYFPVGYLDERLIEFAPVGDTAAVVYFWTGAAFWMVVVAASAAVVVSAAGRHLASDLGRVRTLLRQNGEGSLSHMATWQGNTYWFSPDGAVAVAYRVVSGVAVTMTGPIGPRRLQDQAIGGFTRFCDENGWIPVFYGVVENQSAAFERAGWQVSVVGDDTVLDPASFALTGKKWQDIRSSINRAAKLGIEAVVDHLGGTLHRGEDADRGHL